MKRSTSILCVAVIMAFVVGACSDDGSGDHHANGNEPVGVATQATCPPSSSLTYDSFGKGFVGKYCLGCHSTTVTGDARNGAPEDHNFDTIEDVRNMIEHIDQKVGAGPAATNTDMPRADPRPSLEERQNLATWLACGAP